MNWGSLLAIYFVVWWTILFAILPFGIRTQEEEGSVVLGTAASAPARPRLVRVAVATTIVAAVLTGGFWIAVDVYGLGLPMIAAWFSWRQ